MLVPKRYRAQAVHLTTPATIDKYVDAAVTRSDADLVMLDLEDSIPRGDDAALAKGRANVVRALSKLDWGKRLRFFRPRGKGLDPAFEDLAHVVGLAGTFLDGIVLPKVDGPDEVRAACDELSELEAEQGIARGQIAISVLVESILAEERAFEIARASPRIVSLVFGAFDYWSSLGVALEPYRYDHPLVDLARARIVKAAASVGVPAIAEMTANYPTKDKSPDEQRKALDECRRDAEHARALGFRGKWVGIPAQAAIAREVFGVSKERVAKAVRAVRAFAEAERAGRGAAMIDGEMHDRATDRMHRMLLADAHALGALEDATATELAIDAGEIRPIGVR